MRKVMRAAAGVVAGLAAFGGCAPAYAVDASPAGGWVLVETGAPVDVSETPACSSEGQEYGPCLWDASLSGDGRGRSFIVEEDGSVTYVRRVESSEAASNPVSGPSSVSVGGVHSTASSAVVDGPVDIPSSSSGEKVVGSVDSGVRDNYDREVVLVCAVVVLLGLGSSVWWSRRH